MNIIIATAALALLIAASSSAHAQDASPEAGHAYAVTHCRDCHHVGGPDGVNLKASDAPSFLAIAREKTTTSTGLEVFLTTPHANMPNFIIAATDRANLVAYIMAMRAKEKH